MAKAAIKTRAIAQMGIGSVISEGGGSVTEIIIEKVLVAFSSSRIVKVTL